MKFATVVMLGLVALMIPWSPAQAHYANCAGGSTGSATVSCYWSCAANGQVTAFANTSDGAYNNVFAYTDCGTAHPTCQAAGTCLAQQWTSTHQDNAICTGGSGNPRGFQFQCYEPGFAGSNWPVLDCADPACMANEVSRLADRTLPVFPAGSQGAGIAVFVFDDSAVGFACTNDAQSCVVVPTFCVTSLGGTKTCRAG